MNLELKKIDDYLRNTLLQAPESYTQMSKDTNGQNPLVNDSKEEAYNYDSIVRMFYLPDTDKFCCSCDALLLKNHLYFIEFKKYKNAIDAFDNYNASLSRKKKRHAWLVFASVESKLAESLYVLEKWFLRQLKVDENKFEKHAIIVYDSNSDPVGARADSLANVSGQTLKCSLHERFKGRDKNDKPVFYHNVQSIPNTLFSSIIKNLS